MHPQGPIILSTPDIHDPSQGGDSRRDKACFHVSTQNGLLYTALVVHPAPTAPYITRCIRLFFFGFQPILSSGFHAGNGRPERSNGTIGRRGIWSIAPWRAGAPIAMTDCFLSSAPHPSENKIHLRIQMYGTYSLFPISLFPPLPTVPRRSPFPLRPGSLTLTHSLTPRPFVHSVPRPSPPSFSNLPCPRNAE